MTLKIVPLSKGEKSVTFADIPDNSAFLFTSDTVSSNAVLRIKCSVNGDVTNTFTVFADGSCDTRITTLRSEVIPIEVTLTRTK